MSAAGGLAPAIPLLCFFAMTFFGLGFLTSYVIFVYGKKASQSGPPASTADSAPDLQLADAPQAVQLDNASPGSLRERPAAEMRQSQPAVEIPAQERPPTPVVLSLPAAPAAADVEPLRLNPLASVARLLQRAPLTAAPLSISAQIDRILQQKIAPEMFAYTQIHLVDLPDHTLGVVVGAHTYAGIDSVPDEAVRALIRAAVAEWQKNNLGR